MMRMNGKPSRRIGPHVAAAVLLLLAGACAEVRPFEYTEGHEIPPGPGLFTGEDGAFVLYAE